MTTVGTRGLNDSLWRVSNALQGMQSALAIDHYAMEVRCLRDGKLQIGIRALEGACQECLVSRTMLSNLIRTQVPSDMTIDTIDISLEAPEGWVCDW